MQGERDVTKIREEIRDFRQATTSSFNAMREDLTDVRQSMSNGFTEIRGKFDAAGQQTNPTTNILSVTESGPQTALLH